METTAHKEPLQTEHLCPHSLGTLIEWKPWKNEELRMKNEEVPTR